MYSENRADPYYHSILSKQQHSEQPLELQEGARASTWQLYNIFSQLMGH